MKIFNPIMLTRRFLCNGQPAIIFSLILGSFAFATPAVDINQQPAVSSVASSSVVSAIVPDTTLALRDNQATDMLKTSLGARNDLDSQGSKNSAIEAPDLPADTTAQQALFLVLLSALAGDR